MTDKELKKLSRTELLELMLYLRKELDSVKEVNESLKKQLDEKDAAVSALCGELKVVTQGVRLLCEGQGIRLDRRENDIKSDSLSQMQGTESDGGTQQ